MKGLEASRTGICSIYMTGLEASWTGICSTYMNGPETSRSLLDRNAQPSWNKKPAGNAEKKSFILLVVVVVDAHPSWNRKPARTAEEKKPHFVNHSCRAQPSWNEKPANNAGKKSPILLVIVVALNLVERSLFHLHEGPKELKLSPSLWQANEGLRSLLDRNLFYLYEGPRDL